MTILNLYNKHKAGAVSKSQFLYEARRDANLPWINNFTSYDDAVKILKNRSIIKEERGMSFEDAKAEAQRISDEEGGVAQHVNNIGNDRYEVSDWYDADTTEWSAGTDLYEDHAERGLMGIKITPDSEEDKPSIEEFLYGNKMMAEWDPEGYYFVSAEDSDELESIHDMISNELSFGDTDINATVEKLTGDEDATEFDAIEDREATMMDLGFPKGLREAIDQSEDIIAAIDKMNPTVVMKATKFELEKMSEITDENFVKAQAKAVKKLMKDPNAYEDLILANASDIAKIDANLEMKEVKKDDLVDKPNEMKKIKGITAEKANTKASKKENKKGMPTGVKTMSDTAKTAKGISTTMEKPGKETILEAIKSILNEQYELFYTRTNGTRALKKFKDSKKAMNIAKSLISNNEVKELELFKADSGFHNTTQDQYLLYWWGDKSYYANRAKKEPKLLDKKLNLNESYNQRYNIGQKVHTPDGEGLVKEVINGTMTVELEECGCERDYQINVVDYAMKNPRQEPEVAAEPSVDPVMPMREQSSDINVYIDEFITDIQTGPYGWVDIPYAEMQLGYALGRDPKSEELAKVLVALSKEDLLYNADDDDPDERAAKVTKQEIVDYLKTIKEAYALKDKAGNVQYAKDDTEAKDLEKKAKDKGVQLTRSNV